MKKTLIRAITKAVTAAVTIFSAVSFLFPTGAETAPAEVGNAYFQEFSVPMQILADPMYERMQVVRMAEYVAYRMPFNIIPADLYMIASHEAAILDTAAMLQGTR